MIILNDALDHCKAIGVHVRSGNKRSNNGLSLTFFKNGKKSLSYGRDSNATSMT